MSYQERMRRRQLLRNLTYGAGGLAAAGLLYAIGRGTSPNQEELAKVWEKQAKEQATAEALWAEKLKTIPANVAELLKGIDVPLPSPPPVIVENQPPAPAPVNGETPARAHARDQLNQIFTRHSPEDPTDAMNNEVSSWIGNFVQAWHDGGGVLKPGDTDVIEATLSFTWDRDTRAQLIHIMGDQRQKGLWPGHEKVDDALIDFAYTHACIRWGYDKTAFATDPQYEQTRHVVIETAARARDARAKMRALNLFANPDQAIPSLGTLIPLEIWETGGFVNIGSDGPAREKVYYGASMKPYVEYIATVTRENTGVQVPFTIEGSTAGALGPQIMPPAFTAGIDYVKKYAPDAKLNPLDMTDGFIFASIFLQQNMHNAPQESGGKYWYFSNQDNRQDLLSVMGHWNPEINQMTYYANAFEDYKNRFGSPTARGLDRRAFMRAAAGYFLG